MQSIPYTYLIGWSNLNLYYYGVKFGKKSNPKEFWKSYFTSSKKVKSVRKNHGDPDIIQIRKTFDCPKKAVQWEKIVLRRLDVLHENKWLNQNVAGAQIQTDEINAKRKLTMTGNIKRDQAFKNRVSEVHRGKILKTSTKKILSEINRGDRHPQYGMASSLQKKLKISTANKGNNQTTHQCPHCGRIGKGSIMFRHHFTRCDKLSIFGTP